MSYTIQKTIYKLIGGAQSSNNMFVALAGLGVCGCFVCIILLGIGVYFYTRPNAKCGELSDSSCPEGKSIDETKECDSSTCSTILCNVVKCCEIGFLNNGNKVEIK